jgi:hypothetical protein
MKQTLVFEAASAAEPKPTIKAAVAASEMASFFMEIPFG